MYDQAYNTDFFQKLKLIQYNACPAIIGAISGRAWSSFSTVVCTGGYLIFTRLSKINIRSIFLNKSL